MTQMSLPLYNPQDRGRLNALQNILLAVSDELRQQGPVIGGIIDFTVNEFPGVLRQNTPLDILSASAANPILASPYPFEILDLVQMPNRPQVFQNIGSLIANLNVDNLKSPLQDVELIGIDESQVDNPLPQSSLVFLKSIAFRMYKFPDGTSDEAVGPILSRVRMQLREDESFEAENKLLSYIRNLFIAYISALTALSYGRRPFIVLHGPLVRAIGGFTHLRFDYQTVRDLLNINLEDVGQFPLPGGASTPVLQGDNATEYNLSLAPYDAGNGEENLRRFNEFCRLYCSQCIVDATRRIEERIYPGFCIYFWVLRSLVDLCRLAQITVVSAVENVSRATEMTRFVLPSLLALPQARRQIERFGLRRALNAVNIRYPDQRYRGELYQRAKHTVERLNLSDSNLFSYILAEGQYTAPVQIYRYRTRNTFVEVLYDPELGIRDEFEPILNAFFPSMAQGSHPGYRVLMSYVRTTPLREPIRVEYFDLPHLLPAERVIGPAYLLSLPYQEYGIPMILYYADKLARTPTQLVRAIIEREYYDLVLQNRFSDPVAIMQVLGRLTRNYFQREGL